MAVPSSVNNHCNLNKKPSADQSSESKYYEYTPQVRPDWDSNSWPLQIMTEYFMITQTPALTTRPSVTAFISKLSC